MRALVDFDILTYEIGFAAEVGWRSIRKDDSIPPFDYVAELLDNRIANILGEVGASSLQGYLTGNTNFRDAIATIKPYKGNRKSAKPFHYKNLRAYMVGRYGAIITDGIEADDAMAIEQTTSWGDVNKNTVICTRDKDLRMVPGWHYGWELGNQPSFGPELVDEVGYIKLSEDKSKIRGTGISFFFSQCLTGDPVDNIQGLPKCGPQKAFKLLGDTPLPDEMFKAVREAYRGLYGDSEKGDNALLENGQLLWMVRELDEEGKPVMWRFPDGGDE